MIHNYRMGSGRTGVWKIQALGDGQYYYVKTYSRIQRWHPEVYAYRNWLTPLKPYVPELIEAFKGEHWQGILITPIDGMIMREVSLDADLLRDAYFKAGQLTEQLHRHSTGEWFGRPDKDGNPIELYSDTDPVAYVRSSITGLFKHACRKSC